MTFRPSGTKIWFWSRFEPVSFVCRLPCLQKLLLSGEKSCSSEPDCFKPPLKSSTSKNIRQRQNPVGVGFAVGAAVVVHGPREGCGARGQRQEALSAGWTGHRCVGRDHYSSLGRRRRSSRAGRRCPGARPGAGGPRRSRSASSGCG